MPHHSSAYDKRSNAAFLMTLLAQRTFPPPFAKLYSQWVGLEVATKVSFISLNTFFNAFLTGFYFCRIRIECLP